MILTWMPVTLQTRESIFNSDNDNFSFVTTHNPKLKSGKSKKGKYKKPSLFDFDSDPEPETVPENDDLPHDSRCNSKKLPSVVKLESSEIEQPLPDPFELPPNYRADVEVCLSQRHMTKEATTSFISTVASKMFSYKKAYHH